MLCVKVMGMSPEMKAYCLFCHYQAHKCPLKLAHDCNYFPVSQATNFPGCAVKIPNTYTNSKCIKALCIFLSWNSI